jgi:hypothetical protein
MEPIHSRIAERAAAEGRPAKASAPRRQLPWAQAAARSATPNDNFLLVPPRAADQNRAPFRRPVSHDGPALFHCVKRPMRTFVSCVCTAVALAAAPAFAQSDIAKHPVQFAKGKSGTTIKGSLTGDQTVDYTLRVAAGQAMSVKLSGGSSVNFNVLPPGSTGEAVFIGSRDGNHASITLQAGGEYTIRVYQMGNAASSGKRSNFTLEVAVTGGAQKAAASQAADDDKMVEASARASEGKFNATGKIPCAQAKGQPMGQCDFGVARAGGGTAAVAITRPDGRKRFIFFKAGKAVAADLSQADGNMNFSTTKEADLYMIRAGNERYEIPEAVIYGG